MNNSTNIINFPVQRNALGHSRVVPVMSVLQALRGIPESGYQQAIDFLLKATDITLIDIAKFRNRNQVERRTERSIKKKIKAEEVRLAKEELAQIGL